MKPDQTSFSRPQIRDLFRKHPGTVTELARELGITHPSVSLWLKGRGVSARIAEAAQRKALELSNKEAANVA